MTGCWWGGGVLPECLCVWGDECSLELNTNGDCPTQGKCEMPQKGSPERANCMLCELRLNFKKYYSDSDGSVDRVLSLQLEETHVSY